MSRLRRKGGEVVGEKGRLAVLLLLAILLALPFLHLKPFYSRGEPREALVPQAMLRSGDWVLPQRYGERFATKPPMAHWLMAGVSRAAGGVTEAAVRLPSAVLSVAAVLVFYLLAAQSAGSRPAAVASLFLLGGVEWHRASVTARVDMTLTAFIVLALLWFFRWSERGQKGLLVVPVLLLAGAVLAKGPVGAVLPLAVIFIYLLLVGVSLSRVIAVCAQAGAGALLIAAVWYLAAYQRGGSEFLQVVFSENFGRLAGTMEKGSDPHSHSAVYLLATLLVGMLPWTVLLGYAPWRKLRLENARGALSELLRRPELRLYLFSAVVSLVFFLFYCIPASKRSVYLLPVYPFVCLWLARLVTLMCDSYPARIRSAARLLAGTVVGVCAVIVLAIAWPWDVGVFFSRPEKAAEARYFQQLAAGVPGAMSILGVCLVALPPIFGVYALVRRKAPQLPAMAAYFALLLALEGALLPHFASALSARDFAAAALPRIAPDAPIYSYHYEAYDTDFYLGGRIRSEDIADCSTPRCLILLKKSDLERLRAETAATHSVHPIIESSHGVRKFADVLMLAELERLP